MGIPPVNRSMNHSSFISKDLQIPTRSGATACMPPCNGWSSCIAHQSVVPQAILVRGLLFPASRLELTDKIHNVSRHTAISCSMMLKPMFIIIVLTTSARGVPSVSCEIKSTYNRVHMRNMYISLCPFFTLSHQTIKLNAAFIASRS